jgi:hypothetical protein
MSCIADTGQSRTVFFCRKFFLRHLRLSGNSEIEFNFGKSPTIESAAKVRILGDRPGVRATQETTCNFKAHKAREP